jgi:hypothetical protein
MTKESERQTGDPPTAPSTGPRRRHSIGTTIGGVLAGVDGQIFRTTPPAAELVQSARPVRGVSGEDGTLISIELPEAQKTESADRASSEATEPDIG